MNSVSRSNSNFKSVGRGRGHQSLGRGQSQSSMQSSSDRSDAHMRSRDSYYGSTGHAGTPPHQQLSYPYPDSTSANWRAHSSNNSRNYARNNQTPVTPPTPESPLQPPFTDDELVKFVADAWHEVEHEMKYPRDGFNGPIYYQDKAYVRSRPDFEPFDLEGWHAKRVNRL